MASGTTGDLSYDYLKSKSTVLWTENSKVYTRRARKKAPETSTGIDTAGTGTSTAASTSTENPSTTAASAEVLSPIIAATASTKEHLHSAVASPLKATDGIPATTITSLRSYNTPQECVEASVTDYIDSPQERLRGQSPTHEPTPSQTLADRVVDSFQSQQLLGQVRHDEQRPSVSENDCSSQNVVGQGSCGQSLEQQNQRRLSPLLDDGEAQSPKGTPSFHSDAQAKSPKETSSIRSESEKLQISENGQQQHLRESSPLSSENNLADDHQIQLQNDETSMALPLPAPFTNLPEKANELVQPLVITRIDDRVLFRLSKATRKDDMKELRSKLEHELDQIRKLVDQLEVKEHELVSANAQVSNSNFNNIDSGVEGSEIGGYYHPQPVNVPKDTVERRALVRINSEVSVMGIQETTPMKLARLSSDVGTTRTPEPKSYSRQLSIAVMENNHDAGEIIDKEKRTPKANQYYRNSEFLLGKDRLPPESNKKLKTNHGRKHGGQSEQAPGFGFGFDKNRNQVFKSCSSILQRLMKHKHGWVFNEPVDVKALGLHDYHVIIKHPMDLGTIKTRLSQNWYKSPREFAEDVRLVFRNAMTYNPKGQDVHIMAEELSGIFEEKWAVMETKYNPYLKYHVYQDAGLPTPTSRKFPQPYLAPVSAPASVHASAPAAPMTVDAKIQRSHVGRMPVPKKPKAKDLNKRDMTYEEKQRLSTNLQSLASDKLDAIIQIIKKNNTALSQHDDEIEVDIDSVDPETLWELDRFVSNYKKGLSKNKRKAELALQARTVSNQSVSQMTTTPTVPEVQVESGTVIDKDTHAVEGGKQGNDVSGSSSSSSSSSDSGASSSDSDSGHSSANGSDAG